MQCAECGTPLKLGKFAYHQELCWECFKGNVRRIIDRIEEFYPSEFDSRRDMDIVNFMLHCVRALYKIEED